MINPDDFVITRKRKKYRFAKFANAPNCFEHDDWLKQRPADGLGLPICIELGAGTGMFAVQLARRHPDRVYLAVDVKADRLQKGAYAALDQGIDNVYFLRSRADQINEVAASNSLREIWLTFSDPFLKQRSSGRRMTHPNFLQKYQTALADNGRLLIKHDNPGFFAWTLEQLVTEKWQINELAFDLHDSDLSDDYKIQTTYEQRWLSEGRTVSFVQANKP